MALMSCMETPGFRNGPSLSRCAPSANRRGQGNFLGAAPPTLTLCLRLPPKFSPIIYGSPRWGRVESGNYMDARADVEVAIRGPQGYALARRALEAMEREKVWPTAL